MQAGSASAQPRRFLRMHADARRTQHPLPHENPTGLKRVGAGTLTGKDAADLEIEMISWTNERREQTNNKRLSVSFEYLGTL